MDSNEKRLFKDAQSGNADAFGALYGLYAQELYRYAYAILRDRHTAEDAVQEACIKVYTNIRNIRKPDAVKAYFFKALQNTAKTALRRGTFTICGDEIPEDSPAPDNTESTASDRTDLQNALLRLTEEERQIVLLSAVAGFTSKEIAATVDLTAGAVRSKLSRSLEKLRTYMSEKECTK
ncbi:MAG: RNA polymerase sigma factor [Candidatus Fimenecus sp.]